MSILSLVATVLRDPTSLVEQAEDPDRLAWLVPRLLGVMAGGAAVFGLVVGSYRGGIQLGYAAIKMPLLFGVPLIIGLPAIKALCDAAGSSVSWARLGVAGLAGAARSAVLAAALGPLIWLMYSGLLGYHDAVLLLALALAAVGIPGLMTIGAAVPQGGTVRWLAAAAAVATLGLATAQTGWLLRPFIARPTADVALFRPVEEDVFSALGSTTSSAAGYYPGWEAEAGGLAGEGLRGSR